ncbi:MAG: YggT family protein [Caulobacteraceae bacterium]|nr:YggT family protein [Caulobacteraceae bacterium]
MGRFLLFIISTLLQLLTWAIIANAILSWLIAFDVINLRHPIARQVARFLDAVTAPILRPFQRFIPPIGGIDITPIIALLVIQGVQVYLLPWIFAPIIDRIG